MSSNKAHAFKLLFSFVQYASPLCLIFFITVLKVFQMFEKSNTRELAVHPQIGIYFKETIEKIKQ